MQHLRIAIIVILVAVAAIIAPVAQEHDDSRLPGGQTNFYTDSVQTRLAPDHPFTRTIADDLERLDPRVGIEIVVPVPVVDRAFTETGMLELYNILRRVSTMEGIEYYSASRDEMRIFYHESYAIDGPDGEERIDDPVVTAIPDRDTIHVFQRDGSFGKNVQRLDYVARDDAFLVTMTNTTTMIYKVVPLVSPENLQTFLLILPRPDEGVIEFYGNLGVRVPGLFGMKDRARDSFYNRIVALHDWFVGELVAAGLTTG
jgi:hypothetical protein